MTADEVRGKFYSQAAPVIGEQQAQELAALVGQLDREASARKLMSCTRALT